MNPGFECKLANFLPGLFTNQKLMLYRINSNAGEQAYPPQKEASTFPFFEDQFATPS
jgi:hypothetical protein